MNSKIIAPIEIIPMTNGNAIAKEIAPDISISFIIELVIVDKHPLEN